MTQHAKQRFLIYTDGEFHCEYNGTQANVVTIATNLLEYYDSVKVVGLENGLPATLWQGGK